MRLKQPKRHTSHDYPLAQLCRDEGWNVGDTLAMLGGRYEITAIGKRQVLVVPKEDKGAEFHVTDTQDVALVLPDLPMSVEEARNRKECRYCGERPLFPFIESGNEYAHERCIPKPEKVPEQTAKTAASITLLGKAYLEGFDSGRKQAEELLAACDELDSRDLSSKLTVVPSEGGWTIWNSSTFLPQAKSTKEMILELERLTRKP